MKVKEESEKVGLKFNIQKTKIMSSGPITSPLLEILYCFNVVKSMFLPESAFRPIPNKVVEPLHLVFHWVGPAPVNLLEEVAGVFEEYAVYNVHRE